MPTYQKISADEAIAKRKDHMRETDRGSAVLKAMKAPASWDKTKRSARFVMTTQNVDRYGDVVVTEGVDTTEFEKNPVGLLFHNSRAWPVAQWSNLEKILTGRPKRLEGDFNLLPAGGPVPEVDQTEYMLANGAIRACSIGFVPNFDQVEAIRDDEGRWLGYRFNESELVECSICAVPANPQALVKMSDGDAKLARELVEDVLDNWAKSPAGILMPRSEFEAAYRTVTPETLTHVVKTPTPVEEQHNAADDLRDVPMDAVNRIAEREVVFVTEFVKDGAKFGGSIIAASKDAADKIARNRGLGETVIGWLVQMVKDAAPVTRRFDEEDETVEDKVETKTVATETPAAEIVEKAVDATVEAATAQELAAWSTATETGIKVDAKEWPAEAQFKQPMAKGLSRTGSKIAIKADNGEAEYQIIDVNADGIISAKLVSGRISASGGVVKETEPPTIVQAESILPRDKAPAAEEHQIGDVTIQLRVDTSQVDQEVSRLSGLFSGLGKQFSSLFVRGPKDVEERFIEPHFEEPAAPAPEAIAAAKARSAELRGRVAQHLK